MSNNTLPLADLYTPIQDEMRIVERRFDAEILSDLPFVNALCDRVRTYRGKMLRPAMLLLAGKACGRVSPVHHTLAAVVEIVHVATLVHDDVLDQADVRRRHETVNATAGNVSAVLLGDYLISHAFHLCSSLDDQYASRLIGSTTNTVCEGELMQNHHRGDAGMSESQYLEIIGRKTAALTAASCELGARYAGADHSLVKALRDYGYWAGVAFQIVDDVLDVIGTQADMGKSLGRDFQLGKPTLPILHCLACATEPVRASLSEALTSQEGPDDAQLHNWLETTGSVDYALNNARDHVARAVQSLESVPPGDARASMTTLAEFILRRHH